ncbi:hypothetical protein [Cellulosilyticum ruminicola]|uniref:hypothetical protein n=1 Tax=Cellulosilyticum ruminicola TaxID=425254 RepID=UPI0006CF40D0|nr:hypothetical protein [Cellulosilyticum ruminicola]
MEQQLQGLTAEAIFEQVGEGKVLNTKKNLLDYMDKMRELCKIGSLDEKQAQESYEFIEKNIMAMGEVVKANTIVYLKNELKLKLGKFAKATATKDNAFVNFFKQTYDSVVKTKEYTWVLADITKIKEQQILDTLKTINTYCFKSRLTEGERKDIYPMIERIVDTQNVRLINQVRSMEGIRKAFRIKIVEENNRFKIIRVKR